jgi:hypothetical protein
LGSQLSAVPIALTNSIHQWEQFGKSVTRFRPFQLLLLSWLQNKISENSRLNNSRIIIFSNIQKTAFVSFVFVFILSNYREKLLFWAGTGTFVFPNASIHNGKKWRVRIFRRLINLHNIKKHFLHFD